MDSSKARTPTHAEATNCCDEACSDGLISDINCTSYGCFLKVGYHFGGPPSKDFSMLGSILESLYVEKLLYALQVAFVAFRLPPPSMQTGAPDGLEISSSWLSPGEQS